MGINVIDVRSTEVEGKAIQCIAYEPGQELLVTGDAGQTLRVEGPEGAFSYHLGEHDARTHPTEWIRSIAFVTSEVYGGRILVACGDRIHCIDAHLHEIEWSVRPPRMFGFLLASPRCLVATQQGCLVSVDSGHWMRLDFFGNVVERRRDNEAPLLVADRPTPNPPIPKEPIPDQPASDEPAPHEPAIWSGEIIGSPGTHLYAWDPVTLHRRKIVPTRERILHLAADGEFILFRTLHELVLLQGDQEILRTKELPIGLPNLTLDAGNQEIYLGGLDHVLAIGFDGKALFRTEPTEVRLTAMHRVGDTLITGWRDGTVRQYDLNDVRRSGIL